MISQWVNEIGSHLKKIPLPSNGSRLWIIFSVLLLLKVHPNLVAYHGNDSYTYLLLGDQIIKGSYSLNIVRDNAIFSGTWPIPNNSFPPFYPLILGIVNWILGTGPVTGALINLALMGGSLFLLSKTLRTRDRWIGSLLLTFTFYFVFWSPPYRFEVTSGGAMPLQLFLQVSLFLLLFRVTREPAWRFSYLEWSGIGLILALQGLTRFDHLLASIAGLLMLLIMGVVSRSLRFQAWTGFALGLAAFTPWVIRNYLTFGKFLSSENTRNVFSRENWLLQLGYLSEEKYSTLIFDNHYEWVVSRLGLLFENLKGVLEGPYLAFVVLILFLVLYSLRKRSESTQVALWLSGLFFLHGALVLGAISTVPFRSGRYYPPIWLDIFFILIALASPHIPKYEQVKTRLAPGIIGLIGLFLVHLCWDSKNTWGQFIRNPVRPWRTAAHITEVFKEAAASLKTFGVEHGPVCFEEMIEDFTYYTGIRAIYLPRNFEGAASEDFREWLERFNPEGCILSERKIRELGLDHEIKGDVLSQKFVTFKKAAESQ